MDVMGYHTGAEIPNYWTYARDFVLQDHMFESVDSWSQPAHLYMVSGWTASCGATAMSCVNDPAGYWPSPTTRYRWTDLTYLLHKHNISWGYYVTPGKEPDCPTGVTVCTLGPQSAGTPGIWNPLPYFTTVRDDHQLGNIQPLSHFYTAAQSGRLPAVSWIDPSDRVSEHPPALVSVGQSYVTGLINAIMRGPDWSSTAIFVTWDDWGGFYDHVVPPAIDQNGYGLRVPGLVISPYAKSGYIDHSVLSFDSYNRFIEADFLGGEAIDPQTDGRPDPRPDVREYRAGSLLQDFNFRQPPRQPVLLATCPTTDLVPTPTCH
jgi:phospholipase C